MPNTSRGTYAGDKLALEKFYNARGKDYKDALILQIGFIPEILMFDELDGKPLLSGLSFETMLMCNLLQV